MIENENDSQNQRAARLAWSTLVGACAFAMVYVIAPAWGVPVLLYDPNHRLFHFATPRAGPMMSYYGFLLYSVIAFLIGAAVAWLVSTRRRPNAESLATAIAAALCLVLLDATYYAWRLLSAVH